MDKKEEAYIRQEQYNVPDFIDKEDYDVILEIREKVKTLRSRSSRKALISLITLDYIEGFPRQLKEFS